MDTPEQLENRIRERLHEAELRRNAARETLEHEMAAIGERQRLFELAAEHIMATVVEPRVGTFRRTFPNCKMEVQQRELLRCVFTPTDEYPVSVEVSVSLSHDAFYTRAICAFEITILPIFFEYERRVILDLPLSDIRDEDLAQWLDHRILYFIECYLTLDTIEQYQRTALVVDPVCLMEITKGVAPAKSRYEGKTYYFCTEACKERFDADPQHHLHK